MSQRRSEPLTWQREKVFRHTILTSLSNVTVGVVSALYGVIIAKTFADRSLESDAFFQAFTIYTAFTMLGATLRITVVPLIAGEREQDSSDAGGYGHVVLTMGLYFLIAATAIALFSRPLGAMLGYGLSEKGQVLTSQLLLVFAPAILLQGMAFCLSGALGVRGRFDYVSVSLMVSSVCGLALCTVTLKHGIFSVAAGLATFCLLFAVLQWLRARSIGLRVTVADMKAFSLSASFSTLKKTLSYSSVFVAIQIVYVISQSLASSFQQGMPTVFAYGYAVLAMLLSSTAGSMCVTLSVIYRGYARGERTAFRDYVVEQAAIAGWILCGLLGLLAVMARPVGTFIFSVLPEAELVSGTGLLRAGAFSTIVWSLSVGTWGLGLFAILAPATIAAGQNKGFTYFAVGALCLHLALSYLLKNAFGLAGLGIGYSLTGLAFGAFQVMRLRRPFGARFLRRLASRCFVLPFATAACAWVALAAIRVVESGGCVSLLAGGLVFGLMYLACVLVFDKRSLLAALSHLRA